MATFPLGSRDPGPLLAARAGTCLRRCPLGTDDEAARWVRAVSSG